MIPPELWRQATELARRHGVHATSAALRLDYSSLRRRVAGPRAATSGGGSPRPAFVEIEAMSASIA